MNKPSMIEALIDAVIANDVDGVQLILNCGVDPNACLDADRVTPLHFAAQHNALLVIPLLIAAGADVHIKTEPDGYTPLDIAFLHENFQLAQLLLIYETGEPRA